MKVRASLGTLISLGLEEGRVAEEAYPTTAYLLQYSETGCLASCKFCTQSVNSSVRRDFLSRITWPPVELDVLVESLMKNSTFKRICLQTVVKKGFIKEAQEIVSELTKTGIPVSLCITPVIPEHLKVFRNLGVERLGVGLDAATPEVFKAVSKPYSWDIYFNFISSAVSIFGRRKVNVHLIIGLGEGLKDAIKTMRRIYDLGAEVALFAYTPFRGTLLKRHPPDVRVYRLFQIVNYLLKINVDPIDYIEYKGSSDLKLKRQVLNVLSEDDLMNALLTSGCPYCNRPYYNESPRGLLYNYPNKTILRKVWNKEMKIINEIFV